MDGASKQLKFPIFITLVNITSSREGGRGPIAGGGTGVGGNVAAAIGGEGRGGGGPENIDIRLRLIYYLS